MFSSLPTMSILVPNHFIDYTLVLIRLIGRFICSLRCIFMRQYTLQSERLPPSTCGDTACLSQRGICTSTDRSSA